MLAAQAGAAARAVTGAGRVLHFRPARHWADAKNGSTLYVCFSKRPGLLRRRLECAARAVGMRCGGLSELRTTYVILSRIKSANGLQLLRAFCADLFQMGALPGPYCLLKLLRHRFAAPPRIQTTARPMPARSTEQ